MNGTESGGYLELLEDDLQKEFPGIQGFSARNIWHMRDFCVTNKKLQPLVAEIIFRSENEK